MPDQNSPGASSAVVRRQRVLACVLCQQRKIKCERKFPCANCIRAGAKCIPATIAPRQRRRRFPERELLERLRHYEALLRQHNIAFEPLHADKPSPSDAADDSRSPGSSEPLDELPADIAKIKIEESTTCEAKSLWDAMLPKHNSTGDGDQNTYGDDDDGDALGEIREDTIKEAISRMFENSDDFLFGSRRANVDLSTLHPEQIQIFRLWQIYLENVDPLLKVTHTPTLQTRIIDAAANVASTSPTLEALMFSIYSVSVMSLTDDESRSLFSLSKRDLLTSYQFGCQQALLNCGMSRSDDRDCLTALYLYLISVRADADPRSICSMLAVAIRTAQRLGFHSETSNAKCPALEAEMRRRLWWALVFFDARVCEMSSFRAETLSPTWDCGVPLNVNDFDLRPEMKAPPAVDGKSTEALFVVVRSELGNFIRHTPFHLDFVNPALKPLARGGQQSPAPMGSELATLERMIEDKYLKVCNPENPLHVMTLWSTRAYIAKCRLFEYLAKLASSPVSRTDAQRDAAAKIGLEMLDCDTKLMGSPLTKRYNWLILFHFPFPGYYHLLQTLKRRPLWEHADTAWQTLSDNFVARSIFVEQGEEDNLLFRILCNATIQAWEAREPGCRQPGEPELEAPRIIVLMKQAVARLNAKAQKAEAKKYSGSVPMENDDPFSLPAPPVDFDDNGLLYSFGSQDYLEPRPSGIPQMAQQPSMEVDVDKLDWSAMNWNTMPGQTW